MRRLPYSEIESVGIQRGWGGGLFAYNFKNRLFKTAFLIRKRKGWFTRRILVTPASDSERARQTASALAESMGFKTVDAGSLKNARYLEPLAGLNIYLGYGAGLGTGIAPTWIRKA